MSDRKIGVWLIGAAGGVATTAEVALLALTEGHAPTVGLTTEMEPFASLDLPDWGELILGGHEIRDVSLAREAQRLGQPEGPLPASLVDACRPGLVELESRIRPGCLLGVGPTIAELAGPDVPTDRSARAAVERLRLDFEQFIAEHELEHLVVVNVASTEPPIEVDSLPTTWAAMDRLLDADSCPLPASTLYAIAALQAGGSTPGSMSNEASSGRTAVSYINFTPSPGSQLPALDDLAVQRQARHMGCDGKTGETLLKSVLAPMFARRNLEVMSWVGHNIFGNLDGRVLDDPANKATKVRSKDHLLMEMLPNRPQTHVSIEYIESLGDWKTAWDHIHFRGILGVPMTFQFIWQGCDSVLAAPLVLDLVRLTDLARRRGHVGRMPFLAPFFKSPDGVAEQAFDRQFAMLETWARREA